MNSAKTRKCPFTGCSRMISPEHFACYLHWRSLSQDEQAEIYACYGQWQRGDIDGETLRRRQQAVLGGRGKA